MTDLERELRILAGLRDVHVTLRDEGFAPLRWAVAEIDRLRLEVADARLRLAAYRVYPGAAPEPPPAMTDEEANP